MGPLPTFDTTKPDDPLFGPLSMWLCGDNPFDPDDRPDDFAGLAEKLGVSERTLTQKRMSRRFRDFHNEAINGLDEMFARRQAILNRAFELGMEGNVSAMTLFLRGTSQAQAFAQAGATSSSSMSPADAAKVTDEELERILSENES